MITRFAQIFTPKLLTQKQCYSHGCIFCQMPSWGVISFSLVLTGVKRGWLLLNIFLMLGDLRNFWQNICPWLVLCSISYSSIGVSHIQNTDFYRFKNISICNWRISNLVSGGRWVVSPIATKMLYHHHHLHCNMRMMLPIHCQSGN